MEGRESCLLWWEGAFIDFVLHRVYIRRHAAQQSDFESASPSVASSIARSQTPWKPRRSLLLLLDSFSLSSPASLSLTSAYCAGLPVIPKSNGKFAFLPLICAGKHFAMARTS